MNTTAEVRSTETRLPTPAERPSADIVIFDGNCRMCSAQVRKLAWWDCQHHLAFLSLHDPEVARRFPDLSHDSLMREIYVVDHRGTRHHGAEAFRYLSRRLRWFWWLAPLLHIPGSLPLWQWLYQQVAERRYRFGRTDGCDNGSCELHRK